MKRKKLLILLALEALICAALAAAQINGGHWLSTFLAFPFAPLGRLLRFLSLSGRLGDILAWLVCIGLSLLPLGLLWRLRGDRLWVDALLAPGSILLFLALYLAVNPALASRWLGPVGAMMGVELMGGAVYSVLFTWALLRLVTRMEAAEVWALGRWLLLSLGVVFILAAFGSGLAELMDQINAVRSGNTAPGQPLGLTTAVLCLGYGTELLSWLLDLWVLFAALTLLDEVQRDKTGEAAVSAASELYRRGRLSLSVSLTAALVFDLLQLLLSRWLLRVHTTLRLPVFSVAFLLLMLILSRLLRENKTLRDDNDLFI
ncbi:MAG: hypothetical protein IJE26_02240 [Oscillospiraceae bacterium]|nr:hypothetical protein [Oscillospiraceae bacterium]